MDKEIYAAMMEAARFTREGRLNEATQRIQRALRLGGAPVGSFTDVVDEPERSETTSRLAVESAKAPEVWATEGRTRTKAEEEQRPVGERYFDAVTMARRATIRRPAVHRPSGLPLPGMPGGHRKRGPLSPPAPAEGRWLTKTHTSAAGTCAYKLYLPSDYHGQAMPLVVMLHGCTQGPDDFAVGTRMNFLAEENGFLVAYPAQAAGANASKCWNWFQGAHQQRDQGEPSLIAGLTREVMAEYQVDARRVYVAGLSAGGAMAAIMAAAYPDLYVAFGVHSGLAAGAAHDLPSAFAAMRQGGQARQRGVGHTVPMILFHGDQDTTVHPDNAGDLLRQWVTGEPVATGRASPSVTMRRGQATGGRAYTCETYRDGSGQVIAEQWTIHGAAHGWSGGSPSGSYTDPTGPDASREMVRFFQQHPRENTATPVE